MHNLKDGFQLQLKPKINLIWIVVAFSRPNSLPSIIHNLQNQTFSGQKKLVIVENGAGVGACRAHNFEPDILLTSNAHQSSARNEALHYIKKHGGGIWTTWDDDDYYGPRYLEEIAHHIHSDVNILGKTQVFILNGQNKVWLNIDYEEYISDTIVYGPTITGRAEEFIDFEDLEWGEDNKWIMDMINAGAKIKSTSKYHFLYNRSKFPENHKYPVSDDQLLQCMPTGILELDLNYDVINGKPFEGKTNFIKRQPRKITDSPAYRKLIETHGLSRIPEEFQLSMTSSTNIISTK